MCLFAALVPSTLLQMASSVVAVGDAVSVKVGSGVLVNSTVGVFTISVVGVKDGVSVGAMLVSVSWAA